MAVNNLSMFLSPIVIAVLASPFGGEARMKINLAAAILAAMGLFLFGTVLLKKPAPQPKAENIV